MRYRVYSIEEGTAETNVVDPGLSTGVDIGRKSAYAGVYIAAGSNYAWTINIAKAIFGTRESDKFPFALSHWDGSHPAISIVDPHITRTVQAGLKSHAHLATRLFAMPDAADSIATEALARGKKLN